MDYKARAKSRKLKRKISRFLQLVKFQSLNATSYHKIILFGALVVIVWLFFPWLEIQWVDGIGKVNGFSRLLWVSGITILLLNLFTIFVLLSDSTKEKLKRALNMSFKDYHPPIIWGIVIILMIINSIITMRSLRIFSSEVQFGRGVFIDISWTIILLIGWFYLKKHYDKHVKWIYSESPEHHEHDEQVKDNMKLPF